MDEKQFVAAAIAAARKRWIIIGAVVLIAVVKAMAQANR